jgi:hypothetical protein
MGVQNPSDEFIYIPYTDADLDFAADTAPLLGTHNTLDIDEVGTQTWVLSHFIFQSSGIDISALSFELKPYDGNVNSGYKLPPYVQNLAADARISQGTATWQNGQNGAFAEGTAVLRWIAAQEKFVIECDAPVGDYDRVQIEMGYINTGK